ncbi:hypothetical protein GCM10023063_28470 [Arthrobacter methylotrophus]|uniref:Uncharacterized protein n=1 Tax=Arthrobacter methylotrophus TaxID=121291 RepID=A0ABV5UR69_9MICC
MTATVRSTTGTAPISFDLIGPDQVLIALEDGSQQVYALTDVLLALDALPQTAAAAWSSGYWRGTSHKGPLTDAIVEARNPYRI